MRGGKVGFPWKNMRYVQQELKALGFLSASFAGLSASVTSSRVTRTRVARVGQTVWREFDPAPIDRSAIEIFLLKPAPFTLTALCLCRSPGACIHQPTIGIPAPNVLIVPSDSIKSPSTCPFANPRANHGSHSVCFHFHPGLANAAEKNRPLRADKALYVIVDLPPASLRKNKCRGLMFKTFKHGERLLNSNKLSRGFAKRIASGSRHVLDTNDVRQQLKINIRSLTQKS